MAERGPKVSMAINAPATMISHGMEAGLDADGDADTGMRFLLENKEKSYRVRCRS